MEDFVKMKQVLNKYKDLKTGKEFFIWETKSQYERRNPLRFKQMGYTLEEYQELKGGKA